MKRYENDKPMKIIDLTIQFQFCQLDELNETERMLVEKAIMATDNSYAIYSNFHVGAAVLLDDGSVIIGANQENAAFPSGLCAERTAIFAAQAQYPQKAVAMLAIAAKNEHGLVATPVSPCGACRQVILEVEERYQKPIRILLYGTDGVYVINSIKDLMPLCFLDSDMRQ